MSNLDQLREKLCKGEYSSLSITWNEHACNYCTVEKWLTEYGTDIKDDDFVSLEEKQKAIETNSLWCAHWYPDTPVGFYHIYASTFEALLSGLESHISDEIMTREQGER